MFSRLVCLAFLIALFPALVSARSVVQAPQSQYIIDRPPVWIERQALPDAPHTSSGAQVILHSSQSQISAVSSARYTRWVVQASSAAGIERAAHLNLRFNPRFETLSLHDIVVIRDGRRSSRLKTARIEPLRREQGLENSMLDGSVELAIFVDDVRVGDIVDYEYTTAGANPVFGGRFTDEYTLAQDMPMVLRHIRISAPAGRRLGIQVLGRSAAVAGFESRGTSQVLELSRRNVPPIEFQSEAPPWSFQWPYLAVSEFGNWGEVAQWAEGLFKHDEALPEDLARRVERWMRESADPRLRAFNALRLVQEEVRYLGIELGESSYRPAPIAQTWKNRHGDCKDKAQLLASLLRRMGIEAQPALASLHLRRGVALMPPNPHAFDHVIVAADIGGTRYWLDGTLRFQAGSLDSRGVYPLGFALPARAGQTALAEVALPLQSENTVHMVERISASFRDPAQLEIETRYYSLAAEMLRGALASRGAEAISRELATRTGKQYPRAEPLDSPQFIDDTSTNLLTVRERYRLPDYLTLRGLRMAAALQPWSLRGVLPGAFSAGRVAAVALAAPQRTVHEIRITLPSPLLGRAPAPVSVSGPGYQFRRSVSTREREVVMTADLRTSRDQILPGDGPAHAEALRQIGESWQLEVLQSPVPDALLGDPRFTPLLREIKLQPASPEAAVRQSNAMLARDELLLGIMIDNKLIDGRARTDALAQRALLRKQLGQLEAAMHDLDAALAADAENSELWFQRGGVRLAAGRFTEALDDFAQAESRGNQSPALQQMRGIALHYAGRSADARSALVQAVSLAGGDEREAAYDALWQAIAASKSGASLAVSIDQSAAGLRPEGFRAGLLDFFRGRIDRERLLALAAEGALQEQAEQRCIAHFYIAQRALAERDTASARRYFRLSAESRLNTLAETPLAGIELLRLGS